MPGCKTVDNNLPYYSYRPRIDDWVITGAHAIEEETNRMDAAQHCWISATQKGTGMIVLIYIYYGIVVIVLLLLYIVVIK